MFGGQFLHSWVQGLGCHASGQGQGPACPCVGSILSPPLQYEVNITPSAHTVITVKSKGVIVDVLCELKSCIQTECAQICLSLTGEVAFTSVYCELTPVLQNGGMCLLLIPAARFITCNSLTFPFFTLTFLNCRVWG